MVLFFDRILNLRSTPTHRHLSIKYQNQSSIISSPLQVAVHLIDEADVQHFKVRHISDLTRI